MGYGSARLGPVQHEENRARRKQGKEVDERNDAERHCQPLACKLQQCVSKNIYNQSKCDELVKDYKACKNNFLLQQKQQE